MRAGRITEFFRFEVKLELKAFNQSSLCPKNTQTQSLPCECNDQSKAWLTILISHVSCDQCFCFAYDFGVFMGLRNQIEKKFKQNAASS